MPSGFGFGKKSKKADENEDDEKENRNQNNQASSFDQINNPVYFLPLFFVGSISEPVGRGN